MRHIGEEFWFNIKKIFYVLLGVIAVLGGLALWGWLR